MIPASVWLEKDRRKQQIETLRKPDATAYYGYQQIEQREKAARVRRHFDSVARQYDLMNTLLSFGIHYLWKRNALALMKLAPGERVLDVCGGTGDLSLTALRKVGRQGQVCLLDINRAMIEAGRARKNNQQPRRRIDYIQADAEKLPFPDNYFDKAMVGFGIRNVTHYEAGFREMYRVLKPGGIFMCLEFGKPVNRWFCTLYDIYSFYIMPAIGQIFAGTRQAYQHLPESIRTFPLPEELGEILKAIGLDGVAYKRQTNGIAVIYTGRKP